MNKSRGDLRRFLLGAGKLRQHSAVWRVIQSIPRSVAENISTPAYRAKVTFYVRIAILILSVDAAVIYFLRRAGLRVPIYKVDLVGLTIYLLILMVFILAFGYPISLFLGLMFL